MMQARTGYALARDGGTKLWLFGVAPVWIKANTEQTGGLYAFFEFVVPPEGALPIHVHQREDETVYVLDGSITAFCGDDRFTLSAGGFAYMPRGVPHSYRSEGGPARVVEFTTPSGLEGMFTELSVPADDLTEPPPHPIRKDLVAKLHSVAEKYGLEIIGPLPT